MNSLKPAVMTKKPEIKVIGIEVRTTNKAEMSGQGKIGGQWGRFFQENIPAKIPNQSRPEQMLAIYTDYESDATGEYSFILAKEVSSLAEIPPGMVGKTLPAANYAVFTSKQGAMPGIVIELWQRIWGLKKDEVGGDRAYLADFEVYDARSQDPQNSQVDVFISTNVHVG